MNHREARKKRMEMVLMFAKQSCTDEQRAEVKNFFKENYPIKPINSGNGAIVDVKKSCDNVDDCKRTEEFVNTFLDQEFEKINISDFEIDCECFSDSLAPIIYECRTNWNKFRIYHHKNTITSAIRSNRITVIKGFTGSGKSTQVPQYIMDDCSSRGESFNIVITQPRRVAAKMLAQRVSNEVGCRLGDIVGYQIGLDKKFSSINTRILYCTTGVLLQRMISPVSTNFTHIIVDEVHERSADIDMLLLILKKSIFNRKLNSRIIIMSATFNINLIYNYFTIPTTPNILPSLVNINDSLPENGTLEYSMEFFYLDDIVEKIQLRKQFIFSIQNHKLSYKSNDENDLIFCKINPLLHNRLCELVIDILIHFVEMQNSNNSFIGAVLIFLPGLGDILKLMDLFLEFKSKYKWKLFILHSTISLADQTEALRPSTDGSRHIIFATNIAESSLTVPNVEFVIDFCLCKTLMACRDGNYMSHLALNWSSKSSCDQRAGRTGRTNSGQVFRLIPYNFYKSLRDYEIPEFEKISLDSYVLKAKLLDPSLPPKKVLAYALDPPKLHDIERSILSLKRTGALTVHVKKSNENEYFYDPENGDLTSLGYIMSLLPLDIMLSKLVALGLVFDILDDAITIASAHCISGIFVNNRSDPINFYKSTLSWANNSDSDSFAYLKAYKMFKTLQSTFLSNSIAEKWCQRNKIDYHRLMELETLFNDIFNRLNYNLKINLYSDNLYKKYEQDLILKVIIAGAFYPNYFVQKFPDDKAHSNYQNLSKNTVILNGFDQDSLTTSLYLPLLKEKYKECSSKIDFHVEGSVVHMTFDSNNYESTVNDEDHTLFNAYASHLPSSNQSTQMNSTSINSFIKQYSKSIHSSVYVALAYKKIVHDDASFYRYMPFIEKSLRKQLLNKIQSNSEIFLDQNKSLQLIENNHSITLNICHDSRKFTLPNLCHFDKGCQFIQIHISNFLSSSLFFALYYHPYTGRMLYNINLLSSYLLNMTNEANSISFEVGDLILAPLLIDSLPFLAYFEGFYKFEKFQYNGRICILARAEVLKITTDNISMIYLYYIDFGFKSKLTSFEKLIKLSCRIDVGNINAMRHCLDESCFETLSVHDVHDRLFTIPPLAIKCEMARICHFSSISYYEIQNFLTRQLKENNFVFNAKVFSFINGILKIELFPYSETFQCDGTSLNELLVKNKFAEFKFELDLSSQSNRHNYSSNFCKLNSINDINYDSYNFKMFFENDFLGVTNYQFNINQISTNTMEGLKNFNLISNKKSSNLFTLNNFRIRGPSSPLEVEFRGMTSAYMARNVSISKNSINVVVLLPEISEDYSKLFVASEIFFDEKLQNKICLYGTTLMPNIIDFPAFMSLLFAPTIEFRVNKLVSDYSFSLTEEICGAICGVGFDQITKKSYDPDNDIDFFFDSSINLDDLKIINLLRYHLSQFFSTKAIQLKSGVKDSTSYTLNFEQDLSKRQRKCRELLKTLLFRNRIKRKWFSEQIVTVHPSYIWGTLIDPKNYRNFNFLEFSQAFINTINLKTSVFPPFAVPILNENDHVLNWEHDIRKNIDSIEKSNFDACLVNDRHVYLCKLCMFFTFDLIDFQVHVTDNSHNEACCIFKKFYLIQMENVNQLNQFSKQLSREEPMNDECDDDDDLDEDEFNFNSMIQQEKILKDLVSQESSSNCNIPERSGKDNYNMNVFKRKLKKLQENGSLDIHFLGKRNSFKTQEVSNLTDYFDEDELMMMFKLGNIPNFEV